MYVLDSQGEPVPVGVSGELYIGGVQVAQGYLNRPELTAERFVLDPFSTEPDARLYRTGDVGCWLADGTIEYQGRNDDQVKIRGFRIELGEISSALQGCTGVQEAVVVALPVSQSNPDKRLVAYYTETYTETDNTEAYTEEESLQDDHQAVTIEALKAELSAQLPAHMVPAAYVVLDEMPLTPNGKVNRKALPAPDEEALVRQTYEAPEGEVETCLAEIWQALLGIEQVGRHDNFFELGGHSLLAVQLTSRVRTALGCELALTTLFAQPVLHELAAALTQRSVLALPEIVPISS
ncbi:AMP-binding protein [Vibrio sp. PP-XX7]